MDDLDALREELEAARAEAAALAERLADREAHAATLEGVAEGLRRDLVAADTERRATLARFRETLLAGAPELPGELITGDTLATLDAAVQSARGLVDRVRAHVAAADPARPIPAGSPPRRGPDLDAMSPGEKIRYGIGSQR